VGWKGCTVVQGDASGNILALSQEPLHSYLCHASKPIASGRRRPLLFCNVLSTMPALLPHLFRRSFDLTIPKAEFSDQWANPSDIFTALLILGGDGGEMVAKAVAQLAGRGLVPVAFSIGMHYAYWI